MHSIPINIDDVLNILANHQLARGHVSDGELAKILSREGIDPEGLTPILIKLERDKNVDTHINSEGIKRYAVSVEGKEFIKHAGYAGLLHLQEQQKEFEELGKRKLKIDLANSERVYKSYTVTRIFAWTGAISGLAALLLSLLKLFGPSKN